MGSKLAQKWVKENRMPLGAQKAGLFGAAGAASGGGQIGLFWGGDQLGGNYVNVIDYVTISSDGNATDFGNLGRTQAHGAATDNGTDARGVNGGGAYPDGANYANFIDYVTITSPGDATDFGDLSAARSQTSACSNGTNDRGVFYGGGDVTQIDYITITSTGNAADFGDSPAASESRKAGTSNGTDERGVFQGGYRNATNRDHIDYITINSAGNSSDFGDLTVGRQEASGMSNDTSDRGVCAGGDGSNVIDYITITSTGNSTDFGDAVGSGGEKRRGGTDSGTDNIGIFGGGPAGGAKTIDKITISSTGNASDFGDRTVNGYGVSACANSKA